MLRRTVTLLSFPLAAVAYACGFLWGLLQRLPSLRRLRPAVYAASVAGVVSAGTLLLLVLVFQTPRPEIQAPQRSEAPSGREGQEYFVDAARGQDSHTCAESLSMGKPRATINQGIACLAPGDTLTIRAGTYHEYLHDTTKHCATCQPIPSGTSTTARTTVQGKTGETVIVRPPFVHSAGSIVRFHAVANPSRFITIKHITLDSAPTIDGALGGAAVFTPNHHIRFDGVAITDTSTADESRLVTNTVSYDVKNAGIAIRDNESDGNQFTNNVISNITQWNQQKIR